jgi:uncharacterized protein (TIGR03083 family)
MLADFFDGLDDDQLNARSLCEAWSVREVLGHLVMPLTVGLGAFAVQLVRGRGSVDRASEAIAADLGRRPVAELTGLLRRHATKKVPRPMGQLADTCIHLRDCARPLGLADDVGLDDWAAVLDWLPTRQAVGFLDKGRLDGLALRATDQDWRWGNGVGLAGPSEALAMSITGRLSALEDLTGPGVQELRSRITT